MPDVSPAEVRAQLERILATPGFLDSELKLLVESALTGQPHPIADPAALRSRLEEYYDGPGEDDPVIIEIPKGASVPIFRRSSELVGYQPSAGRKLFMMGLCLLALIVVWVYYFIASKQTP